MNSTAYSQFSRRHFKFQDCFLFDNFILINRNCVISRVFKMFFANVAIFFTLVQNTFTYSAALTSIFMNFCKCAMNAIFQLIFCFDSFLSVPTDLVLYNTPKRFIVPGE